MASTVQRRPLPALIALIALLLLTGLVWWRVLNRSSGDTPHHAAASACPTASSTAHALPAPAAVTVQVLNSTTEKGIAGKARAALIADGFRSPSAASNDNRKKLNKIKSVGEIRYGTAGKAGATLLHYYLPGAVLVPTTSKSSTVVISLGKAYRTVAAKATVAAALKRADLVSGTPSRAANC